MVALRAACSFWASADRDQTSLLSNICTARAHIHITLSIQTQSWYHLRGRTRKTHTNLHERQGDAACTTNMTSSRPPSSAKPQFWRIRKIKTNERDVAKEWLLAQTKELAVAEGQGFSLAADSERTLCATLTSYECPIPSNRSWRVDKDFIGFTPLSDPDDANVDIIAVTGLGGHALGSFRSPDGTIVWLRDFAPEDIPRARFITYGYDTTVVSSDDNQGVHELSRTLLDGLAIFRQRTQTQQRPLLFVCHSLGGVVLKEALVMSSKATESKHNGLLDVMLMTHGLVLMGVPNLGLRHSQLETVVKSRPNEGFVRDLQVQSDGEASQFLSSLTREFSYLDKNRQPPFEIISYYETRSSPTVVRSIVSPRELYLLTRNRL
jgi:hypothetical protein